jgi:hypothetical protein
VQTLRRIGLAGDADLHLLGGTEASGGTASGVRERLSRVTRLKPCKWCSELFQPTRLGQVVCSPKCAIPYQRMKQAKQEKREYRAKSIPLSKLKSSAQREFNHYVRERDILDGCISCHMPADYAGQWHAGHYRTTASAAHLRFNEDNCHKQCAQCNEHKSGNIVAYRPRLIAKIGAARVELLEDDNRVVKWEREELIAIRKEYLGKWKALVKAREAV